MLKHSKGSKKITRISIRFCSTSKSQCLLFCILYLEINMYECSDCEEEFYNYEEYEEHIREERFFACLTCAKEFHQFRSLQQHCEDLMHRFPPLVPEEKDEKLQLYLQEAFFNEKVVVTRTDRKASRKIVQQLIKKEIMNKIVGQRGGNLYSKALHSAGSTATQTKIGKADEYDYNIVLNDRDVWIGNDEVVHPGLRSRYYKFKVRISKISKGINIRKPNTKLCK